MDTWEIRSLVVLEFDIRCGRDDAAYLEYGHHETERHYFSVAVGAILQQVEDSPSKIQAGDKPVHRHFGE